MRCNICDGELFEQFKKCECRLCEDWGGCKNILGYSFLLCSGCNIETEMTTILKEYNFKGK